MRCLVYSMTLALFLLALIALPKLLWQWCFQGKYRESLPARLGFSFPAFSPEKGQKVIWIHAVSMGETRAIIPLFRRIRQENPDAPIVISTTTETGNAEAKTEHARSGRLFLSSPRLFLDHPPPLRPDPTNTLILCESDFWYHLLQDSQKQRQPHRPRQRKGLRALLRTL